MTENSHSPYLLLLSSLVDLAYLMQNQLQESTRLKLLCGVCACKQMFSQVYCIYEIRSAREKVKTKASGACQRMSTKLLHAYMCGVCAYTCVCICVIACFSNQAQQCRAELIVDRMNQ